MINILLVTSIQTKINANLCRAFLVLFTDLRLGIVGAVGFTMIAMMSSPSCVRKSSIFTTGKPICVGNEHSISIHLCSCGGNVTFYTTTMIYGWNYIPPFLDIWAPGGRVGWFGINDDLFYC